MIYRGLILVLGIVLCCIVLFAVSRVFKPNARVYRSGCVRVVGVPRGQSTDYNTVYIGFEGRPYDGSVLFDLLLADGTILSFPDVKHEILRSRSDVVRDPNEFKDIWGSRAEEFLLPEARIIVSANSVRQVVLGAEWKAQAQIRTSMTNRWYALPLSDQDVVDLFGQAEDISDHLWN